MSDIAIRVDSLAKMFHIGAQQEKYKTFRDTIGGMFKRSGSRKKKVESFWALQDVGFEVKQGETVGIVGRNGAGKSTLLKILSRITEPTRGFAEIRGRVASLLEVGTGFHPELTGRENIFLNGAILGMRRTEIENKFDEIVAFAEVERFIDTPVKHYSSGMYLRLAFAVAAHLEPEVLVIDEVLAVGDVQFQKKCLGKMQDVSQQGRTVLFVSHNMSAVKTLCKKAVLLSGGTVTAVGDVGKVIYQYQTSGNEVVEPKNESSGPERLALAAARIEDKDGAAILSHEPFTARVKLVTPDPLHGFFLFCIIKDQTGTTLVHSRIDENAFEKSLGPGSHEIKVKYPPLWLAPGVYTVQFKLLISAADGSDRCLSDPFMLEVDGSVATADSLGTLSPSGTWSVQSQ